MGEPGLSFAGLLRQLRSEAKLTQEELAAAARLSPRSVSDLDGALTAPRTRTTHRQIATLTSPTGTVTSVAFIRDGKTLAAGRADHTVRLWDVAYLVNVVPRLCASAGRSLTRAEWARYVPVLAYQKVYP